MSRGAHWVIGAVPVVSAVPCPIDISPLPELGLGGNLVSSAVRPQFSVRSATSLTIAGSDSGGGAGIQADLKTFAALGVHGTSAVTCITAQSPKVLDHIRPVAAAVVWRQMEAVWSEFKPAAAKTGMLYSAGIVREVEKFFRSHRVPLVVDPVMVATSGRRLLQPAALPELKKLFRLATLITPNLYETGQLLKRRIRSEQEMRIAAKALQAQFGCAVLVKGGHLRGSTAAVDLFFDGSNELFLTSPYIAGVLTHGTGCTYSAAITAYLARGLALPKALESAKEFITQAIVHRTKAGDHEVLNSFWAF